MQDNDFENDDDLLSEQKQERAARTVYVILAVLITATMIISVITAINRRKSKTGPEPAPSVSETERDAATEKPNNAGNKNDRNRIDIITDPTVTKAPPATDPVTDPPEPETDPPVTEPEEPASVEKIYVVPAAGNVLKDYTVDLPVYSLTMNDYRVHNGMDIAVPVGSPVYAFSDGVIERIYYDPMMGQTVVIDHGDGLQSKYQNLQITLPDGIEEGKRVYAGDVIGAVGETALIECAEVPHLHFTVMLDGKYAAPSDYIGSIDPSYDD